MKVIKRIVWVLLYICVLILAAKITGRDKFIKFSYIFLIFIVPYLYFGFKFVILEKDNKKILSGYREINLLYGCRKDRYMGLYNYLYKRCTSNCIEDRVFLRTIKSNYISDRIVVPIVGTMVAVFTIFFNKFETVFSAIINVGMILLDVKGYVDKSFMDNCIGLFYIETIVMLLLMIRSIVKSLAIKSYVNQVLEDIEMDLQYK